MKITHTIDVLGGTAKEDDVINVLSHLVEVEGEVLALISF